MQKLADISKFQNLINEADRALVENGARWDRIKKAAIPLVSLAALHGGTYLTNPTVYAPERPAKPMTSPEVQRAATELYMRDFPLSKAGMYKFMLSHFGPDYRSKLNKNDYDFLDESNKGSTRRKKAKAEYEAQLQKRRLMEQELEDIYAGRKPYPEIVDEDFQQRILDYGKPIK